VIKSTASIIIPAITGPIAWLSRRSEYPCEFDSKLVSVMVVSPSQISVEQVDLRTQRGAFRINPDAVSDCFSCLTGIECAMALSFLPPFPVSLKHILSDFGMIFRANCEPLQIVCHDRRIGSTVFFDPASLRDRSADRSQVSHG
jgi:hypothetical protein